MPLYKLKHKPTGLFYCPSRPMKVQVNGSTHYVKTNLSAKGRVYQVKSSLSWCSPYYDHLDVAREIEAGRLSGYIRGSQRPLPCNEDDWEIVVVG
mgnify:CR=1 FL=1